MEQDGSPALNPRTQLFLAVGQAFPVDLALQVVVQILARVQFRDPTRLVEHLDPPHLDATAPGSPEPLLEDLSDQGNNAASIDGFSLLTGPEFSGTFT
jgi:hypothetical protein